MNSNLLNKVKCHSLSRIGDYWLLDKCVHIKNERVDKKGLFKTAGNPWLGYIFRKKNVQIIAYVSNNFYWITKKEKNGRNGWGLVFASFLHERTHKMIYFVVLESFFHWKGPLRTISTFYVPLKPAKCELGSTKVHNFFSAFFAGKATNVSVQLLVASMGSINTENMVRTTEIKGKYIKYCWLINEMGKMYYLGEPELIRIYADLIF